MMAIDSEALPLIWGVIILFAVYAYVVLDGFDLGIGLLFALFPERADRDVLMNSVAPVWDGNETWLVLGGGGLFAAFPLAYAVLMPAVYAPIVAMLLGLKFRWRTNRGRWGWDLTFIGGSFVAAFSQGIILGAIVQGVTVVGREYAGGWWDWLSPFTVLTGLALVSGYGLLGSTWIVMKTSDALQLKARRMAWIFGLLTVMFITAVSLATPFVNPTYAARWFTWPSLMFTSFVPLAIAAIGWLMFRSLLVDHHEYRPFVLSLLLFALCFVGLGISLFPTIVPPSITLWDAAAPPSSQRFLLLGVAITLPLIIGYTAYAYWVFRGKIDPQAGYH